VLGVIDPGAREPLSAGHLGPPQHALRRLTEADLAELGDRGPEPRDVIDRPPPQRVVIGELEAARLLEPSLVPGDGGPLDSLAGGTPKDLRRPRLRSLLRH